jgi:4-hydroxythreonine-4-phosphate dehydrogenase
LSGERNFAATSRYAARVRIGLTMGDPSGIGPEIALAVAAGAADVAVYGDRGVLAEAAARLGLDMPVHLEPVTRLPAWTPGRPSEASGRAQIEYLEAAVADARARRLDAIVTAPIHKASAMAAGFAFPGHTEFLASALGAGRVTMMFAGPRMRVALATIHLPLAQVPSRLNAPDLAHTIIQTASALKHDFGIARPRLAIAALNPHAGESGHFGDEESRIIAPAIEAARAQLSDVDLMGPEVPDAVFRAHLDGRSDGVVAMYHDQGLIPVKAIDFDEAVNVTLGLPLPRTSPDHGVAHDIAGTGRARPTSLLCAVNLARDLATRRKH